MKAETRFVTADDGTRIAVECRGPKDAPALLLSNSLAAEALFMSSMIDCNSCVIAERSVVEVVSLRPERTSSLARSSKSEMFDRLLSTLAGMGVPILSLVGHTT